MDRQWMELFYTECGRELTLAYEVLNETTNWGVTLTAAVITVSFVNAVKIDAQSGVPVLVYPTLVHWFYAIIAWVIMVRFFVRSCIALVNMYRWNTLILAASKVLSLSRDDPSIRIFQANFAKKVKAYFYDWKSPIPPRKILWYSLKLMYLWFFLILIVLIAWGAIVLEKNRLYWIGIAGLLVPTLLEGYWFVRWHGFQYQKVDIEKEPEVTELWLDSLDAGTQD